MRGLSLLVVAAAMCAWASPGHALYGEYDCAEFADEDLLTLEPLQPPAPTEKPLS